MLRTKDKLERGILFKGGGGLAHLFIFFFARERDDLTSHMHREKESRKEKTREAMANLDVGRLGARITGSRCENMRNKRNYNRSLWIGVRWVPLIRRDFTHSSIITLVTD